MANTSFEFQEFLRKNGIDHILTAPGHPATNGQAENFVKTFKNSLLTSILQYKNVNMDLTINKFLFYYRITKHCTTNHTPSKLMFGREVKSLFSLMKPPIVSDIIKEKQEIAVKNYKGKRNSKFTVGQKVYVRNYKNPNKAGWSPAVIKKKIGPRNYTCLLIHENRDIKRHLDQIRNAQLDETQGLVADDSLSNDGDGEMQQEHGAPESLSFASPSTSIVSVSDSNDTSLDTSDQNDSVPDVTERPDFRTCAIRAKEAISSMFTGSRRQ